MTFFSSSKPLSAVEKQEAVSKLRAVLEARDGQPSVEELLRKGGEPGLIQDQGLDDHTLSRWLRAESYNLKKAEARLRAHAQWRASYVPHGHILQEEIARELATNKAFCQGYDKSGRPLVLCLVRLHNRNTRDLEESKRFVCYGLDAAIRSNDLQKNPDGKIVCIFDLRDLGMDCLDSGVLRAIFDLLGGHYPERLGKLWMYNAPGIFWALWKVVSPFVDSVTKAKIEFVDGVKAIEQFKTVIGIEVLPKELGGSSELVPINRVADEFYPREASCLSANLEVR